MRRQTVPSVTVATGAAWRRLDALLRSPEVVPVYDRRLQPLAGVRWPRGSARVAFPGEIAMFDVDDAGELQEW